jgi:hypothetical protein
VDEIFFRNGDGSCGGRVDEAEHAKQRTQYRESIMTGYNYHCNSYEKKATSKV